MQNNIVSLLSFALVAVWGRFAGKRAASRLYLVAAGFLAAAAIAGGFTGATDQIALWSWLAASIAIAVGLALAAAAYFLARLIDESGLMMSSASIGVAAILPIVVALLFINGRNAVSTLNLGGLAAAAVAFALSIVGRPVAASGRPLGNRLASTVLFLALVGFVLLGVVFFDAVVMTRADDGPFLTLAFAVAGAALAALGVVRRERFAVRDLGFGVVLGGLLFAAFYWLLLSFAAVPSWQAVALDAAGQAFVAGLAFIALFRERWRVVGYVGLVGLAGAAMLFVVA